KVIILQLLLCTSLSAATYYVSPSGNNNNKGTSEDKPFQIVQFAIDQMKAGDTLIILDGFYTGTLHLKSGITIQAQHPRKAVFSGAVPLTTKFEKHTDKIYKTRVDQTIKQLFFKEKPMTWAQWPDMQWSENWDYNKKWALASKGTGPGVLTSDDFSEIADLDLVGGYCFLRYGKGNSVYSRLIESFDGDTLNWYDGEFYSRNFTGEDGPRGRAEALLSLEETHVYHPINSKFFLAGDLDLLNIPGEWFVEDNILYFFPPNGENPNEALVLAKTIDYCIYQEQAVSDVAIEGIDFLGGSVLFEAEGNKNISFFNTYFTYPGGELLFIDKVTSRETDKPIEVTGSNIFFDKCLFAGARYSALQIAGSEVCVQNCVFMENNRDATFEGRALGLNASGTFKITRNTFFNNCSDAIRISVDQNNFQESIKPEVSYNNICNAGKYNSDVSGIYMPVRSQKYTEVHHNWMHNVKGNACRLDVAGKELNVHHNVFWESKRGMSIEGYGLFNIYNNTDVHNEVASDLIRNILNHTGATEASFDSTFAPIDDWNVLNNIVEAFNDGIGPREKALYASQKKKGLVHPERAKSDEIHDRNIRPLEGNIPVLNRGSIQGNLTGENPGIFTNTNLEGLNLIPTDKADKNGVEPSRELKAQGVSSLDSYRGAYDLEGESWAPGSDWMPYNLEVPATMAAAERFAKTYYSISLIPEIHISDLPEGLLIEDQ
ncbi:MAG: right-handed parallel beta-helix repeat-containing protein, partial [Bacteroides sp.]|nr:right-handed parallel beta-helix repeat-containing protein [Bacteroides sp.]